MEAGYQVLAIDGRRLIAFDAIRHVLFRLHGLFRISLVFFVLWLPALAVAAIGPGVAYLLLLSEHDINFYLTHHPPSWFLAIGLSALWVVPVLCGTLVLFVRCLYVIPAWLDGAQSLRKVYRASWDATAGQFWLLLRVAVSLVAAWVAVMFLSEGVIFSVTGFFLSRYASSLEGVIAIVSSYLVVTWLVRFLVVFAGL
jgi:glycerophosphoryl diester phosphodiesterase